MSLRSEARVATPNPERLLLRLCKHFEHRRAVTRTQTQGHIDFEGGTCDLLAEDGVLVMTVTADGEELLARLEGVAGGHLVRMAHGETLDVTWLRTATA
jgi:uncharacterized protein